MKASVILDQQQVIIQKVLSIANKFNSIKGIFLIGSHSIDEQTLFSDIDICLLFETDERLNRKEIFNEVIQIDPILSHLYLFDEEGLFLFESGVRLDITFIKPSEFQNWTLSKAKILKDTTGDIKRKFDETKSFSKDAKKPVWYDSEGSFMDWFYWMFRQAYCYTLQAEVRPNKRFDKLDSAQSSIKSIRDKLISMRIYVNGNEEYLTVIDKNLCNEFERTYVGMNNSDMTKAIRILLTIYENVGQIYAEKAQLEFSQQKVEKMKKLFDMFDEEYQKVSR